MAGGFLLRMAATDDLARLQSISAEARGRYLKTPSLAHVADSPALELARFEPCRIMVAVGEDDRSVLGFVMTRPLDGLLYLDNISLALDASGRGIGAGLLLETLSYAKSIEPPAIALTTFRSPPWNGPWFRRYGFRAMPRHRLGHGLRGVLKRQALTLDPATRETLWLPLG